MAIELWFADGHTEPHTLKTIRLQDAQAHVQGYVEVLRVHPRPKTVRSQRLLANEDGRILGLPHNPRATEWAGYPVVGNVVYLDTLHQLKG